MTLIHDSAHIDSSASIADDVRIGPWCWVGPDVHIGAGTILDPGVTIVRNTVLGCRNHLYTGSVIGGDPQDRKYADEATTLEIGDDNAIREHVTIHRGTGNGGSVTRVGSGNLFMVGSHIAHDCEIGDRVVLANQVMLAWHVRVEDGASIGGGVGVHHFATIGSLSFIGGLARISRDVPPFMIAEGHPAEIRAVNVIGMLRNGYEQADVDAVKDAHRVLFRSGSSQDGVCELRDRYGEVEAVVRLCDAVEASSRGVHGRALESARQDDKWAAAPAKVDD